ncbi:protein mono-ADP-ribosyltransferase PARP10 [Genypterus blacodes]|uniref:protein mono-ADP-ribosyltransferase PARP10 n=1 Tax=Genypterus blacodes TaxID=154954 RepID=UPI003F76073D
MPVENQEERTVEVLGLPEEVDEELLLLYFENKRRSGGGTLVSVAKQGDRALLVFEEAEVAAQVLSKVHHVLHNAELTLRKPPSKDQCRLLLRGLNPSTCTEMLELYVENLMGLDVEDYTLYPSPGKDVVLIQLNQPLSKDFKNLCAKISSRPLEGSRITLEQIEQTDSIIVENLHPGTITDMLILYFESSRGGNQKVKEVVMMSEGTAKVSFVGFEAVTHVLDRPHKLDNADLVVKPYFDFLHTTEPVTQQRTESSSFDIADESPKELCDIQTSSPIAVSADNWSSEAASEPLANCDAVAQVEEETMEADAKETELLSCHVAVAGSIKLALFQLNTFQDLQKAHPDVLIQVKDDGVHISGTDRPRMHQLQQAILEFFGSVALTQFTVDPEKAKFLEKTDVKDMLMKTLNQSGLPAVYTVLDCDIVLTSSSQNLLTQACSFLQSQLAELSIPMDKKYECMLYSREWSEFLQALKCSSVRLSEQGSIDVLTLKGMERDKQTEIVKFLSTPIERDSVINMEPGVLKYIQIHFHQLLAEMDQVSIFPLEAEPGTCGLKIHGNAASCQMAEEVLQGVVSSICTRTITMSAPGVARYLLGEECTKLIKDMQRKFQVYIILKSVHWTPFQNQDIFDAAVKAMAHTNFQKVSSDGSEQAPQPLCATDPNQSGAPDSSSRGLSEEATSTVSVTDEKMEEGQSTSSTVEDMDNVDLYTAGDSACETNQDSDGILISDPAQCSAEGNTTSGLQSVGDEPLALSPCNLEEEAQLSLAIQYSMETTNWSLGNEEEDLQKALELSKKMIEDVGPSNSSEMSPQVNIVEKGTDKSLQDVIQAANTIQIVVFASYNCDLIRVDIALGKKVTQRQVEEKLENRSLQGISEFHKKCIEMIKRKHGVEIQVQGTAIIVSGFTKYVEEALPDVKLLLQKMSCTASDREILRTIQWLQHDPANAATTPYSPDLLVFVENAWRMKQKKVDLLLDNQPHIINFEKMQEYNIVSGKSVQISRKLLSLGELNEDMADEEYSLLSNLPQAAKVDEESDEFQQVVKSFYETIQESHSKIRIIQVEKLVNRLLYNQYRLKKVSVTQRATNPEVERTLYHGTSETSVKEICIHGFNRSFCGKNATAFGQGVYFAINSALSVQDQYSPPNLDGNKFVFVSKVLTGDYTRGSHTMKTAPLKESDDIPLRYDSVTDSITKPSMFVIFNDTQAYPEYLITCQNIHR